MFQIFQLDILCVIQSTIIAFLVLERDEASDWSLHRIYKLLTVCIDSELRRHLLIQFLQLVPLFILNIISSLFQLIDYHLIVVCKSYHSNFTFFRIFLLTHINLRRRHVSKALFQFSLEINSELTDVGNRTH